MSSGVYKRRSLNDRFWSKVNKTDSCWFWVGAKSTNGYGATWVNGKVVSAHRASFFIEHGRWPKEMLDHLCRQKSCVNPEHLEEVSNRENITRGKTSKLRSNKYSNFVGVKKKHNKFEASIWINHKRVYLGMFNTEEEAGKAYEEKLLKDSMNE
jgi:hypothetical protein